MMADVIVGMMLEEVDNMLKIRLAESERRHQEVVEYFEIIDAEMAQNKIETEMIHNEIEKIQDSIRNSLNDMNSK